MCGPDGRAVHPRKGFGTRVGVSNHILNKEPGDGRLPDGFAAKDSRKECVQLGLHVHAHIRVRERASQVVRWGLMLAYLIRLFFF